MSSLDKAAGEATFDRERKVINALETYFSDASLLWDKAMQQKIISNTQGMVPLKELVRLPKVRSFEVTEDELLQYIERHSSARLKLSEDKTRLGRVRPYVHNKKEVLDEWSIYVEGLTKPYHEEFAIKELFHTLVGGHVSFFAIPPNKQGSTAFYGYCFLEFDDKANVDKAIQIFNQSKASAKYTMDTEEEGADQIELDAKQAKLVKKLNLKVISKLEWNRLRDEYVQLLEEKKAHNQKLWDEYNNEKQLEHAEEAVERQHEDNASTPHTDSRGPQKRPLGADGYTTTSATKKYKLDSEKTTSTMNATDTDDYPKGIIVFVDNLHPQCPKSTALKMLETRVEINIPFMTAKKKGLTSAHIRLNTPEDAVKICNYFNEKHAVMQENEKDTSGKELTERTAGCIKMRLLQGAEERIYWENDKRRR